MEKLLIKKNDKNIMCWISTAHQAIAFFLSQILDKNKTKLITLLFIPSINLKFYATTDDRPEVGTLSLYAPAAGYSKLKS